LKVARKPIWVEWVDSAGSSGWQTPHEPELMRCQTLGWLVSENKEQITVALNGVFDGSSRLPFGELITIPKCAVVRRARVKV